MQYQDSESHLWFTFESRSMFFLRETLEVLKRDGMRGDVPAPTILISGERGTGTEILSRMIHQGSARAKKPYEVVHLRRLLTSEMESELFGHERGSGSNPNALIRGKAELAEGGTLVLEDVDRLEMGLQAKLLRLMQEKVFRKVEGIVEQEADVRILASSHIDLKAKVREGKFREDLYQLLTRLELVIPPLKERGDDILLMANAFADRFFRDQGKHFEGFNKEAQESLKSYAWPGNVRELMNVLERTAMIWEGHGLLAPRSLVVPILSVSITPPRLHLVASSVSPLGHVYKEEMSFGELKKKWTDTFECDYLTVLLNRHEGNVSSAAREAQLDRSNFLRLLRKHGLHSKEYRKAA